jgi:hypothetical protein
VYAHDFSSLNGGYKKESILTLLLSSGRRFKLTFLEKCACNGIIGIPMKMN